MDINKSRAVYSKIKACSLGFPIVGSLTTEIFMKFMYNELWKPVFISRFSG